MATVVVNTEDHIVRGYVQLNDSYFNSPTYNTPEWRNLVMCQEVGHTLGLDHQDENSSNPNLGSCMDYTNNPLGPPDNEHPNTHDHDQLVTIYSHRDKRVTIKQSLPVVMRIDPTRATEWGRLIEKSPDGRVSVYMLDFGGGVKFFTWVIWALETDRIERHPIGPDRSVRRMNQEPGTSS